MLIATTQKYLQQIMETLDIVFNELGMTMNKKKPKVMVNEHEPNTTL